MEIGKYQISANLKNEFQTDGRTDGRTNGRMDGRTKPHVETFGRIERYGLIFKIVKQSTIGALAQPRSSDTSYEGRK